MSIHIITSDQGDWVGLYRDGLLLTEGHSLNERDALRALDIDFTHEEWDEAEFDKYGCRCPSVLAGRLP
jgi:hypothetical protein